MEMNYDEVELRRIEEEIHVELIPGTEIMTDVGSHHFVKSKKAHRVLVPQPSDSPHDPLNWSTAWKVGTIVSASLVTFTQAAAPMALGPAYPAYVEEFNCSLSDAVQFSAVAVLILGFSNFLWVPISSSFGRRPAYIFSQLICLGSTIWRARAQTYGSFMGACVLNGLGAGPSETIQPAVIADIFFLHDRGKWNTLYWVTFTGGVMVVPIISGSMTTHLGWRSFWWLNTALVALSTLLAIFLFPETKWHRPHPDEVPHTPTISLELKPKAESIEDPTGDKAANTNAITAGPNDLTPIESPRDPWLGRGKPSKAQWGLYTPNATPLKSILIDVWIPIKLFAFPIVQFASFVVSWSCSSFLVLNMTQSQAFAAPPYNWSSQTVGFTNFAITAGGLIGLFTAGPLSDWVSARATAKNGGIREPEMRLPAMIPYVLIMFLGNIVVSVGYEKAWPWEAIVIIGYTCAGIQSAAIPSIASTYAVDSYKPVASSLFMSVTVYKNLWGYGMGKFLTDWIVKDGYIEPIMINAALIFLWCLFGFLFYFKGKTFRRWSKNSSVHRM